MSQVKSNVSLPRFGTWLDDLWNADRFFNDRSFSKELVPAVNVKEKEGSFEVELTAPGLKKDDFKVHVEHGVLTVSCEMQKEEEEKLEKFTRKEFHYNAFSRSFSLPDNVEEDGLQACYENGLLKISLAKRVAPTVKKKEIEVK